MQEYKVGVCDSDTFYVKEFMEFVNSNKDIPVSILAFSNVGAVKEYEEKNKLDLLILDEICKYESDSFKVLKLTGNNALKDMEGYIYKYQSIYKITENVVRIISKDEMIIKNNSYVYGVYSPLGRCGKTNFARGICDYYEKSFYIGFEEFPSVWNETYSNNAYKDIYEKFMYYLISENSNIKTVIDELFNETGLFFFETIDSADLRQINPQNIEWMVNYLKENFDFKRIIFDFGIGFVSEFKVMKMMDKIFIPTLKGGISDMKVKVFKQIINDEYAELIPLINYVEIPNTSYYSEAMKKFIAERKI